MERCPLWFHERGTVRTAKEGAVHGKARAAGGGENLLGKAALEVGERQRRDGNHHGRGFPREGAYEGLHRSAGTPAMEMRA